MPEARAVPALAHLRDHLIIKMLMAGRHNLLEAGTTRTPFHFCRCVAQLLHDIAMQAIVDATLAPCASGRTPTASPLAPTPQPELAAAVATSNDCPPVAPSKSGCVPSTSGAPAPESEAIVGSTSCAGASHAAVGVAGCAPKPDPSDCGAGDEATDTKTSADNNDWLCSVCDGLPMATDGEDELMVCCDGPCLRSFHVRCIDDEVDTTDEVSIGSQGHASRRLCCANHVDGCGPDGACSPERLVLRRLQERLARVLLVRFVWRLRRKPGTRHRVATVFRAGGVPGHPQVLCGYVWPLLPPCMPAPARAGRRVGCVVSLPLTVQRMTRFVLLWVCRVIGGRAASFVCPSHRCSVCETGKSKYGHRWGTLWLCMQAPER